MRWPGANLEEKHEPRGVSVAEAQNGDSMKSSGRNLTLAAIEKHEPRGVSVAEAQNGDSMKSSGRNLTLAAGAYGWLNGAGYVAPSSRSPGAWPWFCTGCGSTVASSAGARTAPRFLRLPEPTTEKLQARR